MAPLRYTPTAPSSLAYALSLALAFTLLSVIFPRAAHAQDEAPLRMVFLKSDPDDPDRTYRTLRGVLESSDDIELVPADRLMAFAGSEGVTLETFRDGDRRFEATDAFQRAMQNADVESIIVFDIFGGGRTVQLVGIGPWGNELSDVRERISPPISSAESLELFKDAFSMLVPQVRAFRAEQREVAQRQAASEGPSLEEELMGDPAPTSLKDQVVAEQRSGHGGLEEGFDIALGGVFGFREMALTTTANFTLGHNTPLVGIAGRAELIQSVFDGESKAIGGSIWGHLSGFSTAFDTGETPVSEYPGSFSNAGVDADYYAGMSANLILRGKVGAELTSLRIEPNEFYTGNRYIYLRAGAGLTLRAPDLVDLEIIALALPVFVSELSGSDFGSGELKVGFGADTRIELRVFDPFRVSLAYSLRSIGASYPSPNKIDQPATTTDIMHLANVLVGYRF